MKKIVRTLSGILIILILSTCKTDKYTMDDFYKTKKTDTHVHLSYLNPDIIDLAKEDNFHLLYINTDVPGLPTLEKQFECASSQHKEFKDRVDFLTSFTLQNWNSVDWRDQVIDKLKGDFAEGALGIKIWKNIGMSYKDSANHFIMIDDPKFDKIIDFVIQQDKTVLGHLGEPKNCWLPIEEMTVNNDKNYFKKHPEYHMFLHPEYPTYEEQIDARDRFIERHPDMRFVGAHLGSLEWSIDELAKRLDKFPNMAVDMAERICHLQFQSKINSEKVRDFIIKYQDRLLYGTDFIVDSTTTGESAKSHWHNTWLNDWKYFVTDELMTVPEVNGEFRGLQLPREVVNKIYHGNAVRWYKIKE